MKRFIFLFLAATIMMAVHSCGDGVPEPANQAPVPVGTIPLQEVPATDTVAIELSAYFSDPDSDHLFYAASTSDAAVVTASVSGSVLSIIAAGKGTATVTVTASDPDGLQATQSLGVTVIGKPGFLYVTLKLSEPDVGALVVQVEGPSVDSVRAGSNFTAYHVPTATGFRAFVAGSIPGVGLEDDAILQFWSEDITELQNYSATVQQVAGNAYEQRPVESVTTAVIR